MAQSSHGEGFEAVTSLESLEAESPQVVRVGGRSIGLFYHDGTVYATDNRCPHMGFPLTDGTVEDGILTCPWHHARFELSCGDTFDPFADDVQTYPVEVDDGTVYVNPDPERSTAPDEHWRDRLEHGLQENISLVVAKSVIGLHDADVDYTTPVEIGASFGTRFREDGWGSGLTTLGVMANLYPTLDEDDKPRAMYVGLTEVAGDCAGEPPFFVQEPLSTTDVSEERLIEWFRDNIEVRDADGAERVLRAAIGAGLSEDALAEMFVTAATDHIYLDTGHRFDFINKAFETLDHIGWDHADAVLPSLVPGLAGANRAEESSTWRQPIDLAAMRFEASETLGSIDSSTNDGQWEEPAGFMETILGDDPKAILDLLVDAIDDGATAQALARRVMNAAARRVAQFGTSNEFRDWNTVHHTYSYANAVYGMSKRTSTPLVYRGVFDAALKVYLDRFLNMPPASIPKPGTDRSPDEALESLLETFEIESDDVVDQAGEYVAAYIDAGGSIPRLKRALGRSLLREDVGFHTRQNLEAAFAQFDAEDDPDRARIHLIATARYLAAHTPTRRAGEQTYRIAERLNHGEKIHES